MKTTLSFVAGAACALLLAIPLSAADPTASTSHNNRKPAVMPAAWPAETLSGKITIVNATDKLVVIQTKDGTPFDLMVTKRTHIGSGGQPLTLMDLSNDVNRTVSVRFVPEARGDVARSISLGG